MSNKLDDHPHGSLPMRMESVCERDIDLLLLEEFTCNEAFRTNLFRRAFERDVEASRLVSVSHSVTDSYGESDIEVIIDAPQGKLALLLENKIDACFQPDQAERYRQRGDRRKGSEFSDYKLCLVAPSAYLNGADNEDWPCRVSYEEIAQLLEGKMSPERLRVKVELLRLSVKKKENKEKIIDPDVTAFWTSYARVLNRKFPDLILFGAGVPKSAQERWADINMRGWPSNVRISAKWQLGFVDLTFSNMNASELKIRFARLLGDGMSIAQTGKSAVVRLDVPAVYVAKPFESQELDAFATMIAANRLAKLYPQFAKALE
jgi:hypothetical protein